MIKINLKCPPLMMMMMMMMIIIISIIIIIIIIVVVISWLVYLVFASLHTPLSSYKHRSLRAPSPQNVATLLLVHCLEHFSLLYSRHYFHRKSEMQEKNTIFLLFDGN